MSGGLLAAMLAVAFYCVSARRLPIEEVSKKHLESLMKSEDYLAVFWSKSSIYIIPYKERDSSMGQGASKLYIKSHLLLKKNGLCQVFIFSRQSIINFKSA